MKNKTTLATVGNPKTLQSALRWVTLAALLFAFLLFVAGQVVGLKGLNEAMHKLSPATLLLVLAATLVSNLLRFYRWPFFAGILKMKVPEVRLALYYTAGMALLPTPGKVGTALRLWLLNRHHKIDYKTSTPLLLLDVLTDALAIILMLAIALPFMGNVAGLRLGLFLLFGILGALVVLFQYPVATKQFLVLAQRAAGGNGQKFFNAVEHILTQLRTLVGPRNLAIAITYALAGWLIVALGFGALLQSLGYGFNWPLAAFALGGGMVLGTLSLLPGGLGSTEATMFAVLLAGGIPIADATLFTALVRLFTLWLPVAAGAIALPFALRKR